MSQGWYALPDGGGPGAARVDPGGPRLAFPTVWQTTEEGEEAMNEPCDNPTLSSDAITRVLRHLARTDAAQKTQYLLSVAQRARVYLLTQDEVTDLHSRTRGDAEWRIVAAIRCPDGNVYLRANFMGTWEAQRGLVESPVEVVVSA